MHSKGRPRSITSIWFHDACDLSEALEHSLELALVEKESNFKWDVVNQARVHHWYLRHAGMPSQH